MYHKNVTNNCDVYHEDYDVCYDRLWGILSVKNSYEDLLRIIVIFVTSFCGKEKLRCVVIVFVKICYGVITKLLW